MPGEALQAIQDFDSVLQQVGVAVSIYTETESGTTNDAYKVPTGITQGSAQAVKVLWRILSEANVLRLGGKVNKVYVHAFVPKTYGGTAITIARESLVVKDSVDYFVVQPEELKVPEVGGEDAFYSVYIGRPA